MSDEEREQNRVDTQQDVRFRREQRRRRVDKIYRRSSTGGGGYASRGPAGHVRKADRLLAKTDPHSGYFALYGKRLLLCGGAAVFSFLLIVELLKFGDHLATVVPFLVLFGALLLPLRWLFEHRRLKAVFDGDEEEIFLENWRESEDTAEVVMSFEESEEVESVPEEVDEVQW